MQHQKKKSKKEKNGKNGNHKKIQFDNQNFGISHQSAPK